MPRVSIGLPVYNGAPYLAEALDSLLGQTFDDLEVVVCDNASTDETGTIARRYAARDPRVRYHRNLRNVGAAANFNIAFAHARGEYFKWAACDDLCHPEFVARCVERLDRDPGAVLAYTRVEEHVEATGERRIYGKKLATDSPNPVRRFAALLGGHRCYEIFGVIRRHALERTPLMGAYTHGDGVLLARLAFQGRFEEIEEPLFCSRLHGGQSGVMVGDNHSYAVWFNPALRGRMIFPVWRIYTEFWLSILMAPLGLEEFLRCNLMLLRSAWYARRFFRRDVAVQFDRVLRGEA